MQKVNIQEDLQDVAIPKDQYEQIVRALKQAEEEIERGDVVDSEEFFKELRKKYGY